jgi:tight adherence protein B
MTIQLIVILFFAAIFLGLLSLYVFYAAARTSPQHELKKRLRKLAVEGDERISADLANEILLEMSDIDKILYRYAPITKLDRLIDTAGLKTDVKRFLVIMLMTGFAAAAAGYVVSHGFLLAFLFFIIGFLSPLSYLSVKKHKRTLRFSEQFPGTLEMVARSLKSGHSLSSAIQLVGTEMSEPVAPLFKTAYEVQTLGLNMRDSLVQMLERMPSMDLQLFVTAVNIHKDIGGNLAESLERLAHMIRERQNVRRQVRVYSAQARLSAIILLILPIFMAAFFYFTTPGYMEELVDSEVGRYGIAFAVIAQITGFLVIRKIINIKI